MQMLLRKLSDCGIRGCPLSWVSSFLCGRSQAVTVRSGDIRSGGMMECSSGVLQIDVGVPQGSALAPVLFVLYVNDMPDALDRDCTSALYADDTSIVMSHSDSLALANKCNSNLEKLLNWYSQNSLYLNIVKTNYIRFHNYQKIIDNIHITINNSEIQSRSSAKFLGLHIDECMSWSEHCHAVAKKFISLSFLFRTLRGFLTVGQLVAVYHAYVGSRLHYGVVFWGASAKISDVLIAQKRVLRCVLGMHPRASCREVFKSLRVLTVISVYIYELAVHVYKNKNNYVKHADIHDFNTRNKGNFCVDFKRLNVSRKSPDCVGLQIYNRLPKRIKECRSVNAFKGELKNLLLANTLYSMQEFYSLTLE